MNGIINESEYTRREKATAWSVHLLTASGAIWGVLTLVAVMDGRWTMVFLLMMLNVFIDSIDGTLARRAQVKTVLPNFDGALLDNMIDYFTFVLVPAFILYNTYLLPAGWEFVGVSVIVLSSAYQFSQGDAKTDDYYFKGFPSYWNLAVFYLFFLGWPDWVNFIFITFLGVMVFIPIKYIYPSRTKKFQKLTLSLTGIWLLMSILIIYQLPDPSQLVVRTSFLYMFYYFGLSLYETWRSRRGIVK